MGKREPSDGEMLKGTLDMMILRTLVTGDAHGHTIAKVIERTSEDVLEVEQGSPLPCAPSALRTRLGLIVLGSQREQSQSQVLSWLTASGRKQLVHETNRWRQMARAIALVMGEKTLPDGGVR